MVALRDKFTEITTKEVEEQLAKSKYELDDKRMLMLTIGNSRLESVGLAFWRPHISDMHPL